MPAVIFDRRGFIVGRWKSADEYVGRRVTSIRDNKMPAESGVSTGATLEGIPMYFSYARSPVTGWGQEIDRARSREAGFDRHLVKPVDPEELLRALGALS